MPHFTMEFGEVLELGGGRVVFGNEHEGGNTYVENGSFIDFSTYPIFDEAYRARLTGLIIDEYYNQEIAHETANKFRLQFRSHLNKHMPYFNRLYEAEIREIDPLRTIDMSTVTSAASTQASTGSGSTETESTTGSGSRSVFSDLPQTMLAGNEDYASNATDANTASTVSAEAVESSQSDVESQTDGDSQTFGYQGLPGDLIAAYRESLANIDMMVLDSMAPLFMGIWHSGDTATRQEYYYGL